MRQKAPKYGAAVDQRRVFQVGGDAMPGMMRATRMTTASRCWRQRAIE